MNENECRPKLDGENITTLKELIDRAAEQYESRQAFMNCETVQDGMVSFHELQKHVSTLACAMEQHGYAEKHVAILGVNSYLWILSFFAIVYGGGVAVPLNWSLGVDELTEMVRVSDTALILYSDAYEDNAVELKRRIPSLELVPMHIIPELLEKQWSRTALDKVLEKKNRREELAAIVFTSGTTNYPKGVRLTNGNICACVRGNCASVRIGGTSLLMLPLHHTLGLVVNLLSVFYWGYPSYINRSLKYLKRDFLEQQPNNLIVVPMILEMLQKSIVAVMESGEKIPEALLNLRVIICGGAPLREETIAFFEKMGIVVLNGYGTTECSPVIATNRNDRVIPNSVGFPISCIQVRIAADGEIQVRGENVTSGYYNNEEATASAFTEDGWYCTGDLGFLDEHGALHILGRKNNLIVRSNGEKFFPEELENKILKMPDVLQTVVFQENDTIVAEVYLDPNKTEACERIRDDIRTLNLTIPISRNIGMIIIRDDPFQETALHKIHRDYR